VSGWKYGTPSALDHPDNFRISAREIGSTDQKEK
jgi:hypothetical protein